MARKSDSQGIDWGQGPAFSSAGRGNGSGVRVFWSLLVSFTSAVFFIGLALGIAIKDKVLRKDHVVPMSPELVALGIVVIGIACLIAARLLERPLDGTDGPSLLASFRRRFFLWVAVGEVPLFIGMAAVAATHRFWIYLVGAVFAVVGYVRIAPTTRRLAHDQAQLDRSGASVSLLNVLAAMPTQARRRR